MMTDYLIDTHAHLDFSELYDRLEEILENAKKNNVKRIISISTNLNKICLLYTSPSPRDTIRSRMPSSA